MKESWNNRYSNREYVYGTQPNDYFKQEIEKLSIGKLLLPAEGEGRNAVFAAKLGWDVHAIDMSERGKEKALKLAKENNLDFQYDVSALQDFQYTENEYDALALIYAHFPPLLRNKIHQKLIGSLKSDGILLLEAFGKKQFGKKSGGPPAIEMLYSIEELKTDFTNFDFIEEIEMEVELSEGELHKGTAEVIRIKARKI